MYAKLHPTDDSCHGCVHRYVTGSEDPRGNLKDPDGPPGPRTPARGLGGPEDPQETERDPEMVRVTSRAPKSFGGHESLREAPRKTKQFRIPLTDTSDLASPALWVNVY